MSTPQRLLYFVLKAIIRVFLALFYPRTLLTGKEHLHLEHPTLVVSNHPNTLIDALNAAGRVSEPLFMLANAGLFSTPLTARVFSFLYCIPVERPQDVQGRPINNEASFERCYYHLRNGNHIFIAPEGGSELERKIRPLRTGTARIALGAEAAFGFNVGVRILPIGLTYQEADRAGSALAVHVGTPIIAKHWEAIYKADPRRAFRELTSEIEQQLRQLTTDTPDQEMDQLLSVVEHIQYQGQLLPPKALFSQSRALLKSLNTLKATNESAFLKLKDSALSYFNYLKSNALELQSIPGMRHNTIRTLLASIWWFLPWGMSWLIFIIPITLIRALLKRLNPHPGYFATVKWVGALVLLPLWAFCILWIASYFLTGWMLVVPMLILLLGGYIYAIWKPRQRMLFAQVKAFLFKNKYPERWNILQKKYTDLVDRLPDIEISDNHTLPTLKT